MNYKITKKELIYKVNNEMTTYKQYLVHFKVYNEDKTRYRKFKYVQLIYNDDLFEYAEKDYLTLKEQVQITNELISCDLDGIIDLYLKSYDDFDGIRKLCEFCNETIHEFNSSISSKPFYWV